MASFFAERYAEEQRLIRQTSRTAHVVAGNITHADGANIMRIIVEATNAVTERTAKSVVEILQQIIENGTQANDDMPEIYRKAGAAAKQVVAEKLDTAIRKGPGQYRAGQHRISAGRLVSAVENYSFIVSNTGVRFLNKQKLGENARQWARLNFGAESGTDEQSDVFAVTEQYEIKMSNVSLGMFGINGEPGPPMLMPHGPWMNGGRRVKADRSRRGLDKFMFRYMSTGGEGGKRVRRTGGKGEIKVSHNVSGRRGMIPTRGVDTVNYLNPGVKAFTEVLSTELTRMIKDIGTVRGTPKISVIVHA